MSDQYERWLLRAYEPGECGGDGYPLLWHKGPDVVVLMGDPGDTTAPPDPSIKDLVRELAGYRCIRCRHPYPPDVAVTYAKGEWTPCDAQCVHIGPVRYRFADEQWCDFGEVAARGWEDDTLRLLRHEAPPVQVQARYRILTVHHLDGDKANCRWWNLAALCQRCHLTIQGRVHLARLYVHPHTEWFKPYAAGYYAFAYLGEELSRADAVARLDELLNLELDPSYRA